MWSSMASFMADMSGTSIHIIIVMSLISMQFLTYDEVITFYDNITKGQTSSIQIDLGIISYTINWFNFLHGITARM